MAGTGAYIEAIDCALPGRQVTNGELQRRHPEWRMATLACRTGVQTRYWCAPEETALDLAVTAAERLFARLATLPSDIDAVLFCTQTPDYPMPPNACLLQSRLSLPKTVAAFDYSLACSGFVYGLYLCKALIESGSAKRVLLVTAETYSKRMSHDDRGPASLFGDAAAATLVAAGAPRIGKVFVGSDGSRSSCFIVPSGGAREPERAPPNTASDAAAAAGRLRNHISMDGAAVLAFVERDVVDLVRSALAELGETWGTIDLVVFHQASQVALDVLRRRLGVPPHKLFSNLGSVGNTVSASIPLALRAAQLQERLWPGMRVLLVGFGVGLSWAACVVTWQ